MSLARQGKFVEASDCFTEAVRRDPDDWAAIHELAMIAGRQLRHKEAAGLFRRVLLIRPNDPVVRVNLGNALAADGDLNAAIAEYLKVLAIRPGLVEAKLSLAKALARGQRFREAERLYREVLEQQPVILAPGRTRATNAPEPIPPKSAP